LLLLGGALAVRWGTGSVLFVFLLVPTYVIIRLLVSTFVFLHVRVIPNILFTLRCQFLVEVIVIVVLAQLE
jgi:hypothetical protein